MNKQEKRTAYLQFSMIVIPIVILGMALLAVQCHNYHYEPDNIVEELVEDVLKTQIDKTTGLPIDIDLSPYYGPERRPVVWTRETGLNTLSNGTWKVEPDESSESRPIVSIS